MSLNPLIKQEWARAQPHFPPISPPLPLPAKPKAAVFAPPKLARMPSRLQARRWPRGGAYRRVRSECPSVRMPMLTCPSS